MSKNQYNVVDENRK